MQESPVTVRFRMMEECEDLTPSRAHHDDAAFDLKSREEVELIPGQSFLVRTGLFLELPTHYEAQIRPRSGLSLKHTLTLTNSPGTIDAGYRGEVGIIMLNAGMNNYTVKRGERIAQMVINRLPIVELVPVAELSESLRGSGGFGSTGKN